MTTIVVLVLSLCLANCAASNPNVEIVLADDLGYANLGCYGVAA